MAAASSSKIAVEGEQDSHPLQDALDAAASLIDVRPADAEAQLRLILANESNNEVVNKIKEASIYKLAEAITKQQNADGLVALLEEVKPFFSDIAKAKTAKIVRTLIDYVGRIEGTLQTQVDLCETCIAWCKAEKRNFLRLRIQNRLAALLVKQTKYAPALTLISGLLREVKKLDDKPLLVEIHLIESQAQHALRNVPKARAALTAARTAANSIYINPETQAEIDLQAGTLQAEDRDYTTAYSYFLEGMEGFKSLKDPRAAACLKYMVLAKLMAKLPGDALQLINGKNGLELGGPQLDAMRVVTQAYKDRSLHEFEAALVEHEEYLSRDRLVRNHLGSLQDTMLEQNLLRLIEPFSVVEVTHVAELIELPLQRVESKLAEMILDKKLSGTLDQGKGHLVLFDSTPQDQTYTSAVAALSGLNGVVDSLFKRAEELK